MNNLYTLNFLQMRIQLAVKYEMDCDIYVILTNDNGDTYTSKSEELIDFIVSSEVRGRDLSGKEIKASNYPNAEKITIFSRA